MYEATTESCSSGRKPIRAEGTAPARVATQFTSAQLPTGQSAAILQVNRLVRQVAAYDSNVLILGESGTGKEVVARAIHDCSPRARAALRADQLRRHSRRNCWRASCSATRRARSPARSATRKGRFELAEGGTIFLDEIGDMNPTMQVKLLRVLQERVYERVGSCSSQRCDVRIIAATHRNLEESIARGSFREDLYYRLNVVPVEVPPLRERQRGPAAADRDAGAAGRRRAPPSGALCARDPRRAAATIAGPATCASWPTSSNACRSSATAPRSASTICRRATGRRAGRLPRRRRRKPRRRNRVPPARLPRSCWRPSRAGAAAEVACRRPSRAARAGVRRNAGRPAGGRHGPAPLS